jgi:hypothetical protein
MIGSNLLVDHLSGFGVDGGALVDWSEWFSAAGEEDEVRFRRDGERRVGYREEGVR